MNISQEKLLIRCNGTNESFCHLYSRNSYIQWICSEAAPEISASSLFIFLFTNVMAFLWRPVYIRWHVLSLSWSTPVSFAISFYQFTARRIPGAIDWYRMRGCYINSHDLLDWTWPERMDVMKRPLLCKTRRAQANFFPVAVLACTRIFTLCVFR